MSTITLMNNDQRIFCGLYESVLYNPDTDYYLAQTYEQASVEIDENMLEKLIIIC